MRRGSDAGGAGLFSRKPLEAVLRDTDAAGYRRALGAIDLTSIGIAAIIGAGIFVLLGQVARDTTGPAVVFSILLGGVAAVLSALTFAELSGIVPGSGSAYAYAYAALGRLPAFMTGWLVINAYAVGNMTVAAGWSEFFTEGLAGLGLRLPEALTLPPGEGGFVNLPAVLIVIAIALVSLPKIHESALINNLLVAFKLFVVLFVIVFGAFLVDPDNWTPYSPGGTGGVLTGAAVLLFAYLGFDTVAAAAGEAKNPRRDLPIGILASIGVCTLLYVAMGAVVTGLQPSATLESRAPLAAAFSGKGYPWAGGLITAGALVAMTTVIYAFHFAFTRILQAMAQDGFLPRRFANVHASTGTPWALILWGGALTALGAGLLPLRAVADMTVVSTVFLYLLVAAGVLALKALRPDLPRKFRIHWSVPVAAIAALSFIIYTGIGLRIHLVFAAWVGLGLIVFGFYAHRRGRSSTAG